MLQGLKIQLFETRRLTKDGRILDIQLSSALFFDRDEKPTGNIVILRDITVQKQAERTLRKAHDKLEQRVEERTAELVLINENLQQEIVDRQHAEEELRESEKRYRAVVESQTEMICRFLPDGTLTFVNNAYCRFFNMKHKELIGNKFMPFIPEIHRKKVLDSISSLSQDASIVTHEHPVLAPDKKLSWHRWTNRAIFDDHNNLLEYQAVGLDITERKQAERALRESEERFRMIFKNSSDGIIVADPETMKFLYVNPAICKMLGYTKEELTQMGVVDIHPKKSLEYVVSEFEAQARGEKSLAMNIPFLKKNETIIYMDTNSSIVRMGEKISIIGVFRDVTDRKLAEEALQKAHDELESRVAERTRELKIQKSNLEEANIALQVLLDKRQEDKKEIEDSALTNVKELVAPYFEKIKKTKLDNQQKTFLSIMESNLNEIISPFTRKMSHRYLNLTPTEIQVANLIRYGSDSKEIADLMGLSPRTIYNHRISIRKKLGLENKKTNLRSYLLSTY
jgi:PAS domain S-box-containing protein